MRVERRATASRRSRWWHREREATDLAQTVAEAANGAAATAEALAARVEVAVAQEEPAAVAEPAEVAVAQEEPGAVPEPAALAAAREERCAALVQRVEDPVHRVAAAGERAAVPGQRGVAPVPLAAVPVVRADELVDRPESRRAAAPAAKVVEPAARAAVPHGTAVPRGVARRLAPRDAVDQNAFRALRVAHAAVVPARPTAPAAATTDAGRARPVAPAAEGLVAGVRLAAARRPVAPSEEGQGFPAGEAMRPAGDQAAGAPLGVRAPLDPRRTVRVARSRARRAISTQTGRYGPTTRHCLRM